MRYPGHSSYERPATAPKITQVEFTLPKDEHCEWIRPQTSYGTQQKSSKRLAMKKETAKKLNGNSTQRELPKRRIPLQKHCLSKKQLAVSKADMKSGFRSSALDLEIRLIEDLDKITKTSSLSDQAALRLETYRTVLDDIIHMDTTHGHLLKSIRSEMDLHLPPRIKQNLQEAMERIDLH